MGNTGGAEVSRKIHICETEYCVYLCVYQCSTSVWSLGVYRALIGFVGVLTGFSFLTFTYNVTEKASNAGQDIHRAAILTFFKVLSANLQAGNGMTLAAL